MTTLVFLRHFQTDIDPDTPVSEWVLSNTGQEQLEHLLAEDDLDWINTIYTSTEPKAQQTAEAVGAKHAVAVQPLDTLREVDRSGEGFIQDHDRYLSMVEQYLTQDTVPFDWEEKASVRQRIRSFLETVDEDEAALVVTHGLFLSILLPPVMNEERFRFWRSLGFGDRYAVEKDVLDKLFAGEEHS